MKANSAKQLLFGKTRYGTKVARLTSKERAAEDFAEAKRKHEGYGGTVEQLKDGSASFFLGTELHCWDGPALVSKNGMKQWYVLGKRHRRNGPAIEYSDGGYEWFLNGLPHRNNAPAVALGNNLEWWLHGKRHRVNGPAAEYSDGKKEWWLNGHLYDSEEEYFGALYSKQTKS